ncbi:MAG: hypothetical protein M9894_30865 [Planctomycetes bacterium]|nr:hypothetical protein [Planctomycetota bacterium]
MDEVEAALARLRGDRFRGDVSAFVEGGRPSPPALARAARALREERGDVREEVARLVVALGTKTDPLHAQGAQVIRDPDVVAALVADGLAVADPAKDVVLDALRLHVPAPLLRPHAAALLEDLRRAPDASMLLVLARVKPPEGAAALEALVEREPAWEREPELRLARAALGDARLEEQVVDAFLAATDPDRKVALARDLGRVATERALKALASELRTDLIVREAYTERSARLDILEALVPSFLEEPALLPHRILDDEDYARAEAWAERRFGVQWDRPRPEFMTQHGIPHPPEDED